MKWVYVLGGASIVATITALMLAYSGLCVQTGPEAGPFVTAAGFLFAGSGWLLASSITLRSQVRARSLKYLESSNERMGKSGELNELWLLYNVDDLVKREMDKIYFYIHNAPSHPLIVCIRDIANTYENMAIAIIEGAVEEGMLKRSFATNLRWFWPKLECFLSLYRNDPPYEGHPHGEFSNPKVFSHCRLLVERWRGREL